MTNKGFASMTAERRKEVAAAGGRSKHKRRGLNALSKKRRKEIARMGGIKSARIRMEQINKQFNEKSTI